MKVSRVLFPESRRKMPDHGTGKETGEEIKMACFLVPAAEAAVVTAAAQVVKMKEKKKGTAHTAEETAIPFSRKLQWLCNLLWGGSLLPVLGRLSHVAGRRHL